MKKDIRDLFDCFSDETVNIKPIENISPERIIEMTKSKIREENMNKSKKKIRTVLIAAAVVLALSASVFAARHFLTPKEVALSFENYKLAEYFSSTDIKFEIEPQISGEYSIQLLGIASGKNLSSFAETDADKSYIVGAIASKDGEALSDYPNIMITPLVSGYEPWKVNAFTIGGGGRQDFLYEGINYFIFECDNIEIFADHTIYIAAYEGMAPGAEIFSMDKDGTIRFNDTYAGVKAMFTVPFDKSKANPEAAEKLLSETGFFDEASETSEDISAEDFKIVTTENGNEKIIEIREK